MWGITLHKRINPTTGTIFKFGDVREDGKLFYAYTKRSKKDGFFVESWLSFDAFNHQKTIKKHQYETNKKPVLERNRAYYFNKKADIAIKKREYKAQNRARYNELNRARELSKTKQMPSWLTDADRRQIKELYFLAREKTKFSGVEHHVDHIVPLQGQNVSGLHVPWNLQILTAQENLSKHNKMETV